MRDSIDSELKMFDELALDFATRELEEAAEERDRFPFGEAMDEAVEKALGVGFSSITVPEELGGSGQSLRALCLVLEDLSRKDASLAAVLYTNSLAQELLLAAGERKLLSSICDSNGSSGALIACQAFIDPGEVRLGLEVSGTAEAPVLTGEARYVVLAGMAGHALLPAKSAGGEYGLFLVELAAPGIEKSEPVLSLGLHACPALDLALEGYPARPVGEEGRGAEYFRAAADRMQVAATAIEVGIMKGSFTAALDYCRQRRQGGREIVNWSEVRMLLAGMAIKARVSDMLLEESCRAADFGERGWQMGARAASLHVGELACDCTTDGIQLLGGIGYMTDYGQEKRFRDAKQVQALLGRAPMRRLGFISRVVEGERPF